MSDSNADFKTILDALFLQHLHELSQARYANTNPVSSQRDEACMNMRSSTATNMDRRETGSTMATSSERESPQICAPMEPTEVRTSLATTTTAEHLNSMTTIAKRRALKYDASLQHRLEQFLESDKFQVIVASLIFSNFVVMALEQQYDGLDAGFAIGIRTIERKAHELWPNARLAFSVLNLAFNITFALEIIFRTAILRLSFFKHVLNWMDLVVVCSGLVEIYVNDLNLNSSFARLLRLLKLGRGLKFIQQSRLMQSMHLLLRSIAASSYVLGWSLCLIVVVQCIAGMFISNLIQSFLLDPSKDVQHREKVWSYYGTFTRSILTMFEIIFANWIVPCRFLMDNVSEWFSLFFLIYRCLVGFAILNVVNAVFVQQTMQLVQADVELGIRQKETQASQYTRKVRHLFDTMDVSGDGCITLQQFTDLMSDGRLRHWMNHLEIDTHDLVALFTLLDGGEGLLDIDKFLHGACRLRGPASGMDTAMLLAATDRLEIMMTTVMSSATSNAQENPTSRRRSVRLYCDEPGELPTLLARTQSLQKRIKAPATEEVSAE